ncbi:MAG TPA: hypothetical protein LFV92_02955 [Rickettsia endosymbiont of Ceroptres masudai]|nr:hypothetical protein [Rickettsia endosymbiont of Ceroptres masudai]
MSLFFLVPEWILESSLREELRSNQGEAISGVCYYFMRLPRSLWLLAMTEKPFHATRLL